MKTYKIIINGTVQGVFFRKFIQEKAQKLGIKGFCRNLDNGDLEVVTEGKDEKVNQMIEVCKQGPQHAQVRSVKTEEIKHQGFEDFKILRL